MEQNQVKKNQLRRSSSADFMIRVMPNRDVPLSGKVEHVQSGQVQFFSDYLELMILIQKKLDQLGKPQPDAEFRSWQKL